ncbi:MAG: MFS transporter, partial [Chloroflexi bacterium]|nr:MFS transporter [Chloroflexota bacterium]
AVTDPRRAAGAAGDMQAEAARPASIHSESARAGAGGTPLVALPYRSKVLVVGALCVALFVATINQGIVATAAQNIVADIGGFEQFTWLFAGFSLTSAVAVPVVGKLSDLYGRKQVLTLALVLFLVATAACGVARTMPQLIAARAVQGIGFAGVMGSVWIIMAALWAPADRAKWMGVTAAGFTLSGILGPVLGGVVSEALSWRWIFFIGLPVGGIALVLLGVWLPTSSGEARKQPFDYAGAMTFGAASTAALVALNWSGEAFGWVSVPTIGLLFGAVAMVAVFVFSERRAIDPMLPLALFRARIFRLGMIASVCVTVSFSAVMVFLPLFVQGVLGEAATRAAVPLIGMTLGVAAGSNISGQILSRSGHAREIAISGFVGGTVALIALSRITSATDIWAMTVMTFFLGTFTSFGFTAFTVPVQNAMPPRFLGVVTTNLQFARVLGMAAGSAVLGALLLIQVHAALPEFEAGSPQARLADPEVLVNAEQLGALRVEFQNAPTLGLPAYESILGQTRDALADAVRAVFVVTAVVTAFGGVLSIFAFGGRVPADLDAPERATGTGPRRGAEASVGGSSDA